jgi:hypothetical protein
VTTAAIVIGALLLLAMVGISVYGAISLARGRTTARSE